jgi:spore cortex biosynthesis protein YabQ
VEFTFTELLFAFLYSVIIGFLTGFIYEPFRIFHKLGFNKKYHFLICDILFMLICSIILFFYSLATLEGRIRGFVILGFGCGFFIFHLTLSRIFDLFYNPIIKIFKKILKKLLKICRKIMYNTIIKLKSVINNIKNYLSKVRLYEQKRKEKRKNRRGKEKRFKRNNSSKEKD